MKLGNWFFIAVLLLKILCVDLRVKNCNDPASRSESYSSVSPFLLLFVLFSGVELYRVGRFGSGVVLE